MKTSINKSGCNVLRKCLEVIKNRKNDGDVLEFGIFQGGTLSVMAEYLIENDMKNRVFGFDGFIGLPFDEHCWKKGNGCCSFEDVNYLLSERFGGKIPDKITLIKGIYEETFKEDIREKTDIVSASLIHIDCDLRSSCRHVLNICRSVMRGGTFVVIHDWSHLKVVWDSFVSENNIELEDLTNMNFNCGYCDQYYGIIKKIGK